MLYIKETRGDIFKVIGANVRAHMCNVSTGLIGSLETGKVQGISIPVLWNISQILDVSIDKFFENRTC